MHNYKDILVLSLGDFFSPKVMFLTFLSMLLTVGLIVFIVVLIFGSLDFFWEYIVNFFHEIKFDFIEKIQENSIIAIIIQHELIMIVLRYLIGFGFMVVVYYMFFILYSLIISFFSTVFVGYIHKKYYSYTDLQGINILHAMIFYIKTILITVLIFILCIPLYFIPGLNFIIFLPLYYFFHKTLTFDVSSVINSRKEYKKIKKVNWGELKAKTGGCFAMSLVPIIGVLVYPFYIIFISHYIFRETKELRYLHYDL